MKNRTSKETLKVGRFHRNSANLHILDQKILILTSKSFSYEKQQILEMI